MPIERRRQERRATAAWWTANNPALLDGEIGYETDSSPQRHKIGNGVDLWNDLQYFTAGSGDVAAGLPSQTGQTGKYLKTNGLALSWAAVATGGITVEDTVPDADDASRHAGDVWLCTADLRMYGCFEDGVTRVLATSGAF